MNVKQINIDIDTGKQVYSRKEVAEICGVTPQTVRSWENAGVIPPSIRDSNNYRWWDKEALKQIKAYALIPTKDKRIMNKK